MTLRLICACGLRGSVGLIVGFIPHVCRFVRVYVFPVSVSCVCTFVYLVRFVRGPVGLIVGFIPHACRFVRACLCGLSFRL